MNRAAALAIAVAASACTGDIDPAWQLDHERIIAVRADPPAVAAGQTSTITALLGHKGDKMSVATPALASVVSPASLSDALAVRDGTWVVTAPDEARLAAARTELQLAATAPVPLQIGVSYAGQATSPGSSAATLVATKTIQLGVAGDNPPLAGILIDGKPPGEAELVVGKLVKVPLSIDADDITYDVTWLTSCGTMHDFDLPQAYLKVEDDDPPCDAQSRRELAVVVRDSQGGVSWSSWAIRAE